MRIYKRDVMLCFLLYYMLFLTKKGMITSLVLDVECPIEIKKDNKLEFYFDKPIGKSKKCFY